MVKKKKRFSKKAKVIKSKKVKLSKAEKHPFENTGTQELLKIDSQREYGYG